MGRLTVDVIIATHGGPEWKSLAMQRALPSAWDQADTVLMYHDADMTLAQARNAAAESSQADIIVFLDADDELAPGYIHAIKKAAKRMRLAPALLAPRVQYVRGGVQHRPDFPNRQVSMHELNWCVIGTGIPRPIFESVGGFREWPCYEDWELFLRCMRAGAAIIDVPDAIYRAHISSSSSRNTPAAAVRAQAYADIRAEERAETCESAGGVERAVDSESAEDKEQAVISECAEVEER